MREPGRRGCVERAWLTCSLWLLACGGSQPPPQVPVADQPPGELAMREPDSQGGLDTRLEPVAPGGEEQGAAAQPAPEEGEAREPIAPRGSGRRSVELQEGTLSLPGGLTLRGVPRGARAWQREDGVWEVTRGESRLLVLLRATSLSQLARSDRGLRPAAAPMSTRVKRDGWGPAPVQVIVERFTNDTHTYTIERRAAGTDWVPAGLELSSPR